jgi:ABC-type multidrug transport system ATPase subunit
MGWRLWSSNPRGRLLDGGAGRSVVELQTASKRYSWDGLWVLREVSVEVAPGTLVKVRGVNGSGKSTLLRLLGGATGPSRGRRVAARALTVGYAPERLAPPPPFSAAAFLVHHARLRGCTRADGKRHVQTLAARLALTSLLPERLDALSKGSLQKVVLVQALLGEPALVVLDEPFGGLDLDAQQAMIELLGERKRAGSAVVLSDHLAIDARPAADLTWHLADGGLRAQAAPRPGINLDVVAGLSGVLESHGDEGALTLLVERAASDSALARLLDQGWHVHAVRTDGAAVAIEARRTPAA